MTYVQLDIRCPALVLWLLSDDAVHYTAPRNVLDISLPLKDSIKESRPKAQGRTRLGYTAAQRCIALVRTRAIP